MKPAARITDMTMHAGKITTGCPSVLIGGLRAARVGDGHECPVHGKGKITTGCGSVIVGGSFASRIGDLAGCATESTLARVAPGKAKAEGGGQAKKRRLEGEHKGSGFRVNEILLGGKGKGSGKALVGEAGEAEVFVERVEGEVYFGPPDDYGANPLYSASLEGTVGSAEAKGDALFGDDGNRVGVGVVAKAGANAAGIKGKQKSTFGFGGYNIQLRGEMEGSEGVGAGLGHWGYYDRREERVHFGAFGTLKAFAGLELLGDISIGKAYPPGEKPVTDLKGTPPEFKASVTPGPMEGIPNIIITGFESVVIG